MRIALVSTPFLSVPPRNYGGTELVVYELAEGLHSRGHRDTAFATADSSTTASLRALYPTAQWPPNPLTDLNHVSWAFQQIRDGAFDVVHAHSAAALALHRFVPDVPLVYTLHHPRDENLSSFFRYFPDVHYVAISSDQKQREIELPNVSVIHHGLDVSQYEWRERPDDYVAFVGRLSHVKGPHTAMDVARRAGLPIRVAGEVHEVDGEFGEREVKPRLKQSHVS